MSQPRYAPAGSLSKLVSSMRISVQGCLFAALLAALVAMLGLPALGHPARKAAAAAPIGQADTGGRGAPDDVATLLQRVGITPSTIATAVPGATPPPAGPVDNGGLIGPAGVTGELGIPAMVLQAYRQAAAELAKEQPGCHLPWWLLAGIGHTESGHAEDGRLYADGTTRGRILGPRLNGGIAGDAIITDTDHGVYDGDTQYDRAVGPMQFIPSTWRVWGADGNHDGKRDPNNIFDATLAAGHYLCADGRNLATMAGLTAAVLSYNHSQAYLNTVLAWGLAYRSGASSVPDQTIPVVGDVTKVRPPLSARPPVAPRPLPRTAGGTPTRAAPTGPAGPTSSTPGSSPATP
ncbi:MAG TPA: lytic murein transglycosylase, partial [Jatrophihabitans sp.]|nr:lytic murein transglycosylase [Jatrophihabitans sp.]